ncbi:MAG: hypothetical protein E6Q97_26730 [Desulfurellales bacterium]|nr:MAG: hypothetical protein E6Q97_26730 [Desulfurellales bacterium]
MSEIGDKMETVCGHCGEYRECTWGQDPYMLEIYPEDKDDEDQAPQWWCEDCFSNRAADV